MQLSDFIAIIPKRRIKQAPLVVIAMIIGAGFEVLGIGLIIPIIDILSGSDNTVLKFLGTTFPSLSRYDILILSLMIFAATFVLKGMYLTFLTWLNARYSYTVKADISQTLIAKYLAAPYEFHLQRNSAQLIRNLTTESDQLVIYGLNPLLTILSEGAVILTIGIFLLFIEPIGTLVVISLLVILSFVFQRTLSEYIKKIGIVRQDADGMLIQKSQEALGGIKDVKVLGKEQHFLQQFEMHNRSSSDVSAKQHTLIQIPRMYLETIGAVIFSVLIFLLISEDEDFQKVFAVLGVFALSAFRLLPSANRILSSLNALCFVDTVVATLSNHLTKDTLSESHIPSIDNNIEILAFNRCIKIENLSYQYPGTNAYALSDINFTIMKGESIGIVGKSGSGKSTLSDTILGLLKPCQGSIYVDDMDIHKSINSWNNLIGYVPQDIFLLDESIRRNIAFGEIDEDIDSNRINDVLTQVQLNEFISSLPKGIDTHLGERGVRLSGGQKQRIAIARALYRNTQALVFDEASSSLDNETESEIVSAIKSLKGIRTTIIIAHRLSTIEHCDRVVELNMGRIARIKEQKH